MNKELIKKCKAEFDHRLNGGEGILSYCFVFTGEQYQWLAMYEESDVFEERDVPYDIKSIVINDEYVEFRKALAEGKTIQVECDALFTANKKDWLDLTYTGALSLNNLIEQNVPPCNFRIKPEEPQFKVGDFVRVKLSGDIFQYKQIHIEKGLFCYDNGLDLNESLKESEVAKWEPQVGELIWVTDDISEKDTARLVYFEKMLKNNYQDTTGYVWIHCEPFLNSKPSWFNN